MDTVLEQVNPSAFKNAVRMSAGFVNAKDNSFPKQLFAYCVDGIASECA
jgi:hypothetical protein